MSIRTAAIKKARVRNHHSNTSARKGQKVMTARSWRK
jgi:hypothetical protein